MLRKLIGKIFGGSKKKSDATHASGGSRSAEGGARGRAHSSHGKHPGGGGAGHSRPGPQGTKSHGTHGQPADRDRRHGDQSPGKKPAQPHGSSHPPRAGEGRGHAPRGEGHAAGGQGGERSRGSRRGGRGSGGSGRGGQGPHGGSRHAEHGRRDDRRHDDRGPRQHPDPRDEMPTPVADENTIPAPEQRAPDLAPSGPIEIPAISTDNEFTDLGLEPFIVAAIDGMGYQQPTPIQSEAIPMVLAGRDVIGSAQTGTGKTAAFALPIMQKLGGHGKLRCLILEPTRELAVQVDEAVHNFKKYSDLRAQVIFGGVGYGPQKDALARGLDIVVATPGRLLDHIEQRTLRLEDIQYLVLDEVDRMLDMGFLPDVKRIIEMCPKERQTLFFSATIPPELAKLTSWCLRDPHTIEIGQRRKPAETVSHAFYPVIESQKFELLKTLLEQTNYDSVIIFCRTKHGADFIANRLLAQEHKVAVMHSNRSQAERMDALKGFKSGKYEVLVATDLAARGLDIAGVTHVINYDTPQHAEDYVHRIGRTGRAQSEGDAFTLLTEEETKFAHMIERFIEQKVERKKLENFPYQYSAVFESQEGGAKNAFRSRLYRGTRK